MVTMFSFKDAVHDHITIGFVDGCIACAQVQADMALSKRAYAASTESEVSGNAVSHSNQTPSRVTLAA
jgi:hypothetical protein